MRCERSLFAKVCESMRFDSGPEVFVRVNQNYVLTEYVLNENDCISLLSSSGSTLRIGYRLRKRSDIWSTNRGAAEVGTPDIRPTTEDDIRHNATTQDKDLSRIITPFRFRFYFHYRMLRKKAKQPFEASLLKFF